MITTYDYISLLHAIMQYGRTIDPRGKEIKELMHIKLIVSPRTNVFSFPGVRELDFLLGYSFKELAWYCSGDRSAEYAQKIAKLWSKITNIDGTLNSNYGYLVYYHKTPHPSLGNVASTPFSWALHSLQTDKNSRQAIMTYNNGGYNYRNNHDYICTQHQAFFIRENILTCYIAIRSSDSIFGLPYNMIWWSLVHQDLYLRLKVQYPELKLGNIEVDIYSSHVYAQHYELVEKMLLVNEARHFLHLQRPIVFPEQNNSIDYYLEQIPKCVEVKNVSHT